MNFSEQHDLVTAALLKVQAQVEPVLKDAQNPHLKNRYATLGAITEYLRPMLAAEGLFLMQGMEPPAIAGSTVVGMVTRITHASGQWVESRVYSPMADASGKPANVQIAGSIITYLRRYGLSAIFALTTEDDDGQAAMRQSAKMPKAGKVSDTYSAELNARGVTKPEDAPFPPMRGLKEFHHKRLKSVPTNVVEEAYTRATNDSSDAGKAVMKMMEDELERRRNFNEAHPALKEPKDDLGF